MRGRASGFGARISSMEGLCTGAVHRTDHGLDEGSLFLIDLVRLVQSFVSPGSIHRKIGDEGETLAVQVLRILPQRDQETHESSPQVDRKELRLLLGVEAIDD